MTGHERAPDRGARPRQGGGAEKKSAPRAANGDVNLRALEHELESATGMKTAIIDEDGAGTITFVYSDLDQLDALLAKLRR